MSTYHAKTGHCLQRQASELQPEPELYALTDEEDDNEPLRLSVSTTALPDQTEVDPPVQKRGRGRPPKQINNEPPRRSEKSKIKLNCKLLSKFFCI